MPENCCAAQFPKARQGLDWLNFFLADIQTGFGAFVAFYLAELGWPKGQVGLALSVGTIAGLVAHIPGGALVDWAPWKRGLAALGLAMIAAAAVILALVPSFVLVFAAEILHGLAGGIITPAIAAISLGLVGRRAMSARTGRNYGFDAAGNALTAGAMGLAGQYIAKSAIFLGAAALCIPALIALSCIRADEIDDARARNAGLGKRAANFQRLFDLGKNTKLYVFAACIFLFQFADASMLPVISENLASKSKQAGICPRGWSHHRTSDRCCTVITLGWLSFGKVRTQVASASGLRGRSSACLAICSLLRILGPYRRPIAEWNQCCHCNRPYRTCDYGSNDRHGTLQSRTRFCWHRHRYRSFNQHWGYRLYFRASWPPIRFHHFGRSGHRRHGLAVDRYAGD